MSPVWRATISRESSLLTLCTLSPCVWVCAPLSCTEELKAWRSTFIYSVKFGNAAIIILVEVTTFCDYPVRVWPEVAVLKAAAGPGPLMSSSCQVRQRLSGGIEGGMRVQCDKNSQSEGKRQEGINTRGTSDKFKRVDGTKELRLLSHFEPLNLVYSLINQVMILLLVRPVWPHYFPEALERDAKWQKQHPFGLTHPADCFHNACIIQARQRNEMV